MSLPASGAIAHCIIDSAGARLDQAQPARIVSTCNRNRTTERKVDGAVGSGWLSVACRWSPSLWRLRLVSGAPLGAELSPAPTDAAPCRAGRWPVLSAAMRKINLIGDIRCRRGRKMLNTPTAFERANCFSVLQGCRVSAAPGAICPTLRGDRDFQHPVSLMGEKIVGLLDVLECEAVSDQRRQIDPARRNNRHEAAHSLLTAGT